MADEFVVQILKSINLPQEIIDYFKDQEINEHAFKSLNESIVKELIPTKIGYRSSVWCKITDLNKLTDSSIASESNIDYNIFSDENFNKILMTNDISSCSFNYNDSQIVEKDLIVQEQPPSEGFNNNIEQISEQKDILAIPINNMSDGTTKVIDVFKIFLEQPNVFKIITNNLKELFSTNGDIVSSMVLCNIWKERRNNFPSKIILPFLLYFDDSETNNPLGSHAGKKKMGAVYNSLSPCLPYEFSSTLDYIFLALIFNSLDRIEFGNFAIFQK
ncbi:hypothetical protein QTP88_015650 [Uroleucon formosanum]